MHFQENGSKNKEQNTKTRNFYKNTRKQAKYHFDKQKENTLTFCYYKQESDFKKNISSKRVETILIKKRQSKRHYFSKKIHKKTLQK